MFFNLQGLRYQDQLQESSSEKQHLTLTLDLTQALQSHSVLPSTISLHHMSTMGDTRNVILLDFFCQPLTLKGISAGLVLTSATDSY